MTEDANDGAAGESPDSDSDATGEETERADQSEETHDQTEQEGMSPEEFRALSPAMQDGRFATTIRLRGELGKPAMTGEGSEDELSVKIKVAGADLSDLHHSLRPYAGRIVEAVILPVAQAEEKLPWETPPHPDQTRLPLEGEAQEGAGQFVCIACGTSCEIGVDGHCPACGGALRPGEETEEAQAADDQPAEEGNG